MSTDYSTLILASREAVQAHRRLVAGFKTQAAQARKQLQASIETLRRSKSLPGLRYADHRDTAPRQRG